MRFVRPVRPIDALVAAGELVSNPRDKLFEAGAELRNQEGVTLVTATGEYLTIKQAHLEEMVADFMDDASWVFGPEG